MAVSLAGAALALATGCTNDLVIADAVDCDPEQSPGCEFASDVIATVVQSGPAGQNPDGRLRYQTGLGMGRAYLDAHATCLNVNGGTAIIGFAGTLGRPDLQFQVAGLARLRDLGPRDSGEDTFKVVTNELSEAPGPGPTTCSSFPGPFSRSIGGDGRNVHGDVFVFDAQFRPGSAALRD